MFQWPLMLIWILLNQGQVTWKKDHTGEEGHLSHKCGHLPKTIPSLKEWRVSSEIARMTSSSLIFLNQLEVADADEVEL